MMKKNVIFLTFVLAFICTLSVVHSQYAEVQGTTYEITKGYDETFEKRTLLVSEVGAGERKLIKTISSDDFIGWNRYHVTNNYLYYSSHDNYVMRMSFYTFEIENINIQTFGDFKVSDDDSIICVSVKIPELSEIINGHDYSTLIPSLYDVKTKEEIKIKGLPIDSLELAMRLSIEYRAVYNGFNIAYKIDSPNPVLTGFILLDDFTYVETHIEMPYPFRYYSGEPWSPSDQY